MPINTPKRIILIAIILIVGVAIAAALFLTRPRPKQASSAAPVIKVKTISITPSDNRVIIDAMGITRAAHRINLKSRVGGDIVAVNPNLVPGAQIPKGEIFVEIDKVDYTLALHRAEVGIAEAQQKLLQEQGRQEIAKREWQLVGLADTASDLEKQLALRRPQLEVAKATVKSAKARFSSAQRDLEYCQLKLPFNSLVIDKHVNIGSRVAPNSPIADVVSSDSFWITAKVPAHALKWIEFPSKTSQGSKVDIFLRSGRDYKERVGRVIKRLPLLEKEGRMAQVLVEIKDPLALKDPSLSPLFIGSFVRLKIIGTTIPNSYKLPRSAERLGSSVHIARPANSLEIRPITKIWGTRDYVIVSDGLRPEDRIVNSYIPFPVDGLELEVDDN